MLKVMRNVCLAQSVLSNRNITGILSNRILDAISIEKHYNLTRSTATLQGSNPETNNETGEKKSGKKVTSPQITVISTDSKLTVMTLEEAHKLSKRRDLKLVKLVDVDRKTQRPVYKLMTGAEYFKEDISRRQDKSLKKSNEAKSPKLLTLSANIGSHDLESKINNIIKWLNKRHEVRIVINVGGKEEAAELVAKTIENETKPAGKMVQKRRKGDDIKFQLLSLKLKESDSNGKADEKSHLEKPMEET